MQAVLGAMSSSAPSSVSAPPRGAAFDVGLKRSGDEKVASPAFRTATACDAQLAAKMEAVLGTLSSSPSPLVAEARAALGAGVRAKIGDSAVIDSQTTTANS